MYCGIIYIIHLHIQIYVLQIFQSLLFFYGIYIQSSLKVLLVNTRTSTILPNPSCDRVCFIIE